MIGCLGVAANMAGGFKACQRLLLLAGEDCNGRAAMHCICDTCHGDRKGKMGDEGLGLTAEGLAEVAWCRVTEWSRDVGRLSGVNTDRL